MGFAEKLAGFARRNFDKQSETRWKSEPWVKLLPLSLQKTLTEVFLVGVTLHLNATQMMANSDGRGRRQLYTEECPSARGYAVEKERCRTTPGMETHVASRAEGKSYVATRGCGARLQFDAEEGRVYVMGSGSSASYGGTPRAPPPSPPSLAPPLPATPIARSNMQSAISAEARNLSLHLREATGELWPV